MSAFLHASPTPTCPVHPGSFVRRYRTHGPSGPGVYPQCVPREGQEPHLLRWIDQPEADTSCPNLASLSASELAVLADARNGMTVIESAANRSKSAETVKSQRRSILRKLGAHNMAHAIWIAGGERSR